ncbi:MAG: hypothetical protein ACE361_26465 [Aureliella sp.]
MFYLNNRIDRLTPETTSGDIVIVEAKKKFNIAPKQRVVLKTNLADEGTYLLIWMMPRKPKATVPDASK